MILEGIALFVCWEILGVKAHSQFGLANCSHCGRPLAVCAAFAAFEPQVLRPPGLEPGTPGLEGRCSIRLSYGRGMNR